jgi:hypothetical protein
VDRASKEGPTGEEAISRLSPPWEGEAPPSDVQDGLGSSPSSRSVAGTVEEVSHVSTKAAHHPPLLFDPFGPGVIDALCSDWFQKYHAWFPILHQPSLLDILQSSTGPSTTIQSIVLRAIAAVVIPHCEQTSSLTREQRQKLSDDLRGQIVIEAISHLTLQSLQAVLILTIRDWGMGRLIEFWNLVALAKRCLLSCKSPFLGIQC